MKYKDHRYTKNVSVFIRHSNLVGHLIFLFPEPSNIKTEWIHSGGGFVWASDYKTWVLWETGKWVWGDWFSGSGVWDRLGRQRQGSCRNNNEPGKKRLSEAQVPPLIHHVTLGYSFLSLAIWKMRRSTQSVLSVLHADIPIPQRAQEDLLEGTQAQTELRS